MGRLNLLGGQNDLLSGQMPTQLICYLPPWSFGVVMGQPLALENFAFGDLKMHNFRPFHSLKLIWGAKNALFDMFEALFRLNF